MKKGDMNKKLTVIILKGPNHSGRAEVRRKNAKNPEAIAVSKKLISRSFAVKGKALDELFLALISSSSRIAKSVLIVDAPNLYPQDVLNIARAVYKGTNREIKWKLVIARGSLENSLEQNSHSAIRDNTSLIHHQHKVMNDPQIITEYHEAFEKLNKKGRGIFSDDLIETNNALSKCVIIDIGSEQDDFDRVSDLVTIINTDFKVFVISSCPEYFKKDIEIPNVNCEFLFADNEDSRPPHVIKKSTIKSIASRYNIVAVYKCDENSFDYQFTGLKWLDFSHTY